MEAHAVHLGARARSKHELESVLDLGYMLGLEVEKTGEVALGWQTPLELLEHRQETHVVDCDAGPHQIQ